MKIEKRRRWSRGVIAILLLIVAACATEDDDLTLSGTWSVEENSQLYGVQHYDAHISQIDSSSLEIDNFYNIGFGTPVTASLSGDEINIPQQEVEGYIFAGSGEVSEDKKMIIFNFTANDKAVIDHVIAQYRR